MTEDQKNEFLLLKKQQVNKFPLEKVKRFEKYKSLFYAPACIDDIKNLKDIEIEWCETKEQKEKFLDCVHFQTIYDGKNLGVGRNICFFIKYKEFLVGMIRMTGISINTSNTINNYIGWDDKRFKNDMLQRVGYAQTIIPCQPFGFNCCGGKLLAGIVTSKEVTDKWESKFNTKLYAVLTYSMTPPPNQYTGLKTLKYLGVTSGEVPRGIYFAKLYENSNDILSAKTQETTTDLRLTLSETVNKWIPIGEKRYKKLLESNTLTNEVSTYEHLFDFAKHDNIFFG